jgi:hypothetical protein
MQIPQIISHGPIFRRRPSHFVEPTVVDPVGNFELDLGPIIRVIGGSDPDLQRCETAITRHIVNDFAILAVGDEHILTQNRHLGCVRRLTEETSARGLIF